MLRHPSKKSSSGRSSELEPVSEVPPLCRGSASLEWSASSVDPNPNQTSPEVLEYPTWNDDEEFDPEYFGMESSLASAQKLAWSSSNLTRASYNARPASPQSTLNPSETDDCFFGTQPDYSPLTSSFPPPERTPAFHLPYTVVHRPSRNVSISDAPSSIDTRSITHSSEESHSGSGTTSSSSANSSVPVTPLSPALAEIVDAVAKVTITLPSPDRRLSRQTSLQSIDELASFDGHHQSDISQKEKPSNLSNFPTPPQAVSPTPHRLPRLNTSLSNISETESHRPQDWLRIDTSISPSQSPGESFSSLDLSASSSRSLSTKSSFDRSFSDRRSSMTPVPHSVGGLARLLSPKRSSSRLEKDLAKARSKADKLEQKLRDQTEKEHQRMRDQSDKEAVPVLLSGIWSPKNPKLTKSDEKKRKKELLKQKTRSIAEEAMFHAEDRGFEGNVGKSGEKWAVSGLGGL